MPSPRTTLDPRLDEIRRSVDRRLDELVPAAAAEPRRLHQSIRHSLLAPAKRLRPALTILVAEALGGDERAALDPACAIEMVHTASLILDDLPCMDDAARRRGQPSNHVAFGQDIAMLASVSLLNRAFGVLASTPTLDASSRVDLVARLSRFIGSDGVIAGQTHDLHIAAEADADVEDVERIARLKTGALFAVSAEIGAIVAGADPAQLASMHGFGHDVGLCFQILDDLADVDGCPVSLGKDVGQDADRSSFVSALGTEEARFAAQRLARTAVDRLVPLDGHAGALRQLVDRMMEGST